MIYHHIFYHRYIPGIECGNHLFEFFLRTERTVLIEPPHRIIAHTLAVETGITITALRHPDGVETTADDIGL